MSHTACTITHIQPHHDPNEGRNIINENFDCINATITDIQAASATGATIVTAGTNTEINTFFTGITPIYQVDVVDSPAFNSISFSGTGTGNALSATTISGGTFYSGNTELSEIFASIAPPPSGNDYGSAVSVAADGLNSYTGTSSPTITAYTVDTIYLTQFSASNTSTATTLNIDGLGALDIVKGTENGLEPLEVGEIQTGVTYYLTYDGAEFQFFDTSPSGTTGTYTNLNPTTTTIGGVLAGTTFSGATWQSVFNTMFYPTLVPYFTSFVMRAHPSTASTQSQTLEVGDTVTGGTRVFTWATSNSAFVKPNTIVIRNVTSGNAIISTPASGMTNDSVEAISGLANVTKSSVTSHTWRIFGTRTNNSSFNLSFAISWYFKRMFGVSTATTLTTSAEVYAFSGTGSLTNSIAGTYAFVGAGYKYFFFPTTTTPTLFRDSSTQLAVAMATTTDEPFFSGTSGSYNFGTVNVTNQFGISQSYRIYRTRNYLNGNITIVVT